MAEDEDEFGEDLELTEGEYYEDEELCQHCGVALDEYPLEELSEEEKLSRAETETLEVPVIDKDVNELLRSLNRSNFTHLNIKNILEEGSGQRSWALRLDKFHRCCLLCQICNKPFQKSKDVPSKLVHNGAICSDCALLGVFREVVL